MHTVIGVFDSSAEASQAKASLLRSGFDEASVDVSQRASGTSSVADTDGSSRDGDNAVTRFFKELFGSDDDARRYSEVASRSDAVVTVHARSADESQRAVAILDDAGAIDCDAKAQEYGVYGTSGQADVRGGEETLKVIEEDIQVGKREVETGGARVRSRIVERPVEESVRLRQERVWVERTAVNRPANAADLAAFREGQIEVVEHAEVPVVAKEARVVEEIKVRREEGERTETIRDTVRGTEVDVEELPTTGATGRAPETTKNPVR